jgi:1,4-alpha-glucan branching enzyme
VCFVATERRVAMIIKKKGRAPDKKLVTFRVPGSVIAESVHVVGDFNDWNRHSHPLRREHEDGTWELTIELEEGQYQFRYLVDGKSWQNEWHADRYVPNPFGGENSMIEV